MLIAALGLLVTAFCVYWKAGSPPHETARPHLKIKQHARVIRALKWSK